VCVCVCVWGGGGTRCSHISMSRTCIRSRSATYSQQIPTKPMPVLMNPAAMAHNLNGISDAESPYFGQGREHSDTSPAASIQYLACARARVCVCVCVCGKTRQGRHSVHKAGQGLLHIVNAGQTWHGDNTSVCTYVSRPHET
jgi:hypothetical protein